jgi:hypothetical protein
MPSKLAGMFRTTIARCRMRTGVHRFGMFLCLGFWLSASSSIAQESLAARREKVESLSLNEQQQLLRNLERFNELPEAEQKRLRVLHQQIEKDANSTKLSMTLARYTEWLKDLPEGQRAELASLDSDARIEQIRRIFEREHQEQEGGRRKFMGGEPLPREDMQTMVRWFGKVVWEHREELLAKLPPKQRADYKNLDEFAQRRRLLFHAANQWQGKPLPVKPEEIESLKRSLSSGTQDRLAKAKPELQDELLREFLRQSVMSRMGSFQMRRSLAMASPDELDRFFEFELSKEDRERLSGLPQEEMRKELQFLYFQRARGPDGPPMGRHQGPRFGPPDGRNRQRRPPGDDRARPNRGGRPDFPSEGREGDRPPFDPGAERRGPPPHEEDGTPR